eukprot:COSAG05_NODE_6550_length_939_cov_1.515476_2_plen_71_part_01
MDCVAHVWRVLPNFYMYYIHRKITCTIYKFNRQMSENGWVVICPTSTMCTLHLSNGGSTILMLSSGILKGY